jgi:hypothetical protein
LLLCQDAIEEEGILIYLHLHNQQNRYSEQKGVGNSGAELKDQCDSR